MRRILTALCVSLAVFSTAWPAQAQDWLSTVVDGLKQSPVYIAQGAQGVDSNTAADLQAVLNENDNVVLVMLPKSAQADIGSNLSSFAADVSSKIGSTHIIGIAVGSQSIGYAAAMPAGVAEDLMHRAVSVSTSPVDTLTTFVRNVHLWQSEHPEAKTTAKPTSKHATPWYVWLLVVVVFASILVFVWRAAHAFLRHDDVAPRKSFKGPDRIKTQLNEIIQLRDKVNDADFKATLYQCCLDIERYFMRYSSDVPGDAIVFSNHLSSVISVLKKYIDVQEYPRDFNNPADIKQQAVQSIKDFAEYVMTSIRRGNEASLIDYRVDTQILQAKRFA